MFLIIGLGNPGKKFEKTRHNTGFRIATHMKEKYNFSDFKMVKKLNVQISEGVLDNAQVILVKPQTFMNESGKAVKSLIKNLKLKIEDLFIIHDDLDLPLGKIRISKGRGSAGHKGVEGIINALKTNDFMRFRIGIKPVGTTNKDETAEVFVLKKFAKDEEKILEKVSNETTKAIATAVNEGIEKAMNEYNKR